MSIGGGHLFWKGSALRRARTIPLLLILVLTMTAFQCGSGLSGRVAKAVSSIPSVVRVLFPNADPNILSVLDAAGAAFKEFTENKTSTAWQKAEAAWNTAKPLLARLNNSRINQIVAVVDILIGQVTVPSGPMSEEAKVVVQFNERDVKTFEELVK